VVPTGAKVGIDATIPEGIPREHYERITYAYADTAQIEDYVKGKTDKVGSEGDENTVQSLADEIFAAIDKGRSITQTSQNGFRRIISAPLPARSVTCTRPSDFGRMPAVACAFAAQNSPRRREEIRTIARGYCSLSPAARITRAQVALSATSCLAKASGGPPMGEKPSASIRSVTSGSAMTLRI